MADGVARSPSRFCSRDGKINCYGDALSTIFLLACLKNFVPCFLLFVFRFSFLIFFPCISVCLSSSCPFICAAAICYSQQVRILYYVFFLLVSFVPYPIWELFCFFIRLVFFCFFFVALISRVAFLLLCSRTRYASTWFAYLDSLAFGFSLSHRDHRACKRFSRMKNQHGHWVCWMSTSRKNGLM